MYRNANKTYSTVGADEKICSLNCFVNSGCVFKSCGFEWIVVMQKLPDSITNETRKDVHDLRYAGFRADRLIVIKIINKFTDDEINEIENTLYTMKKIKYRVGEVVEAGSFDTCLDKVMTDGIHYYRTPVPAYYLEIDQIVGKYRSWYDNGQLHYEYETELYYCMPIMKGIMTCYSRNGSVLVSRDYTNLSIDDRLIRHM